MRWDEEVDGSFAILDLKALLSESCDIATEHQRLVYKGRVLQDALTLDSSGKHRPLLTAASKPCTLAVYQLQPPRSLLAGVKDGGQIYLVRGSGTSPSAAPVPPVTPTAAPEPGPPSAATPFGMAMGGGSMQQMQQEMMQNPEMVRQMMNSPLVEAMMNDPDMLQNMVQSNPQLKQMMESNPEVGHLLSDPAVLRQSLETARNPQLMREMMRNTDRAMSNIEAHPEGFNMLRRLYTNVQQPLSQLGQPSSSDDGPDVEPTASPTTPNTTALPNPWAPAPPSAAAASPAGLFGPSRPGAGMRNPLAFAQMFGGAPGVPPPNRPPAAAGLDALAAPAGGVGAAFGAAAAGGAPPPFQAALAQLQLQQQQAQMGQPAAAGPPAQLLQQLAQSNPAVQQMLRDPAFMQQVQRQVQARMGGAAAGAAPGAAAGAPPAPYDLGAMMQLLNQNGSLPGLAGGGVGAAAAAAAAAPAPPAPPAPPANPGQLYAAQLQTLTDMGFFDSDANLRALVSTGGNVQAAVERLLS